MLRNNKLWYIFIIALLMNGCEKKTVSPDKEQAEKPEINSNVEREDKSREAIISDTPTEITKVGITLKYNSSEYDRTVYVDQNSTELYFVKNAMIGIEGLNQLKFLETIVFSKEAYLYDYSFLTDVPQLKRLFIDSIHEGNVDWSFVERLPDLEVLHVQSYYLYDEENRRYYPPTISIDLKNNKHLEYIGFKDGVLKTFPVLLNIPDSLIYLNLQGNEITSLPADFMSNSLKSLNLVINNIKTIPLDLNVFKDTTIFLQSNAVRADAKLPSNIVIMGYEVYEEKYRFPLNIPFISGIGD